MAKSIKVKAGEDLSPAAITRAIELLENKGTKKAACGVLGIAYNTKRLQTIIDNYTQAAAADKRLRAKKRGKPVDKAEAKSIIYAYLTSGSMEEAGKVNFRPVAVVSRILEEYGARLRAPSTNYFDPILLPDACMAESFEEGEYVWSARWNALAEIKQKRNPEEYLIWVLGANSQYSYQPPEELGSLKHLQELGINFQNMEFYYQPGE